MILTTHNSSCSCSAVRHNAQRSGGISRPTSTRLRFNRSLQADPTFTTSIRNKFAADLTRRFKSLRRSIFKSVVANDVFGLKSAQSRGPVGLSQSLKINQPLPERAFQFLTDPEKVEEFMEWLRANIDLEILETSGARRYAGSSKWMNTYIDSAYKKGIRRADQEMRKAGMLPPVEPGTAPMSIDAAFVAPVHADKVGMIYIRTYEALRGVTDEMSKQISQVLAQGIADGLGPRKIAREMVDRVDKIGITRARTIARTEVIRAHHVATVNTYRQAGVEGVRMKAEWATAGDDRVCPDCAYLEGTIFTVKEIEPLIPLHPNCRCVALPAGIGEEMREALTDREIADSVSSSAVRKDGTFTRQGFYEKITGKPTPAGVPAPGKRVSAKTGRVSKTKTTKKRSTGE